MTGATRGEELTDVIKSGKYGKLFLECDTKRQERFKDTNGVI
jgi:hypothetical protein